MVQKLVHQLLHKDYWVSWLWIFLWMHKVMVTLLHHLFREMITEIIEISSRCFIDTKK